MAYDSTPTVHFAYQGDEKSFDISFSRAKATPNAADIKAAAQVFDGYFSDDTTATFTQAYYTFDSIVATAD